MRFSVSRFVPICTLFLLLLSAVGCAKTSPFIGTWSGSQAVMGRTVTAALDLKEGGTGTATIMGQQRTVKWTESENTLTLTIEGGAGGGANAPTVNITGTLGDDKKTMDVNMGGPITIKFTKQGEAK